MKGKLYYLDDNTKTKHKKIIKIGKKFYGFNQQNSSFAQIQPVDLSSYKERIIFYRKDEAELLNAILAFFECQDDPKSYLVYYHQNKINFKGYVGITKQIVEKRWHAKNAYNEYFTKSVDKHGWEGFNHFVISCNLREKEAKAEEIRLIKQLKTRIREHGYNITKGGDLYGSSKYDHDNEFFDCYDISEIFLGTFSATQLLKFGLELHDIRRCANGEFATIKNHIWRKKGESLYKYDFSKSYFSKKVCEYDLFGKLLNIFDSVREAEKIRGYYGIGDCCLGRNKTVHGMVYKFEGEPFDANQVIKENTVLMYDENHAFLKEFFNVKQAADFVKGKASNIQACCSGRSKTAYGYFWKYGVIVNAKRSKSAISIDVYTKQGIFVENIKSVKGVQKKYSCSEKVIKAICKGRKSETKGLVFRFAGDPFDKYPIVIVQEKKPIMIKATKLSDGTEYIFESINKAFLGTGVDRKSILRICRFLQTESKGYTFCYA